MNHCEAMSDELIEVALGRPASEALRTHLEECSACAAELERQRALAGRMDAAVNALVRSQPPSRLLASIAARARNTPQTQRWNRALPRAAVVAALVASIAGLIFGFRAMHPAATPASSTAALAAWRSPTAVLLKPRGSVLHAPLRDIWFDPKLSPSRSQRTQGDTHAT
jgi:anti-sigma factor RsiW